MKLFDYTFGLNIPKLKEFTEKEEFLLSEKILDYRFAYNKTPEEMADLLGISTEKYLEMEFACISVPIEDYRNTVNKLKSISNSTE